MNTIAKSAERVRSAFKRGDLEAIDVERRVAADAMSDQTRSPLVRAKWAEHHKAVVITYQLVAEIKSL